MAKSTGSMGTLSWSAKLDSNEFKKGVRRVKREMKDAQKAVGKSLKMMAQGFTIATGAITGVTIALGTMVKQSAEGVRELENLSKVADTSFQDFQKMAFGAKKFGIEQDKLSDILKDIKDRVGDFIATGGGPMADFFENIAPKVGVTAEAFKDLSGKDALQLFYNSLEKANLSQSEMVFYMEAMASDLTMLQPLLANNGRLFDEMGQKAVKAGAVLPQDKVEDLKKALTGFDELSDQMTASVRSVSAELAPQFVEITDDLKNILTESDLELKVMFDSLLGYFQTTLDGMRYALENVGIIDEFYTWQDAFLDVGFFLQNTFNYLMLAIKTGVEKMLSTISYPFRLFIAGVIKGVEMIFRLVRKLVSLISNETKELDRQINELNDAVVAYDVTSLTGAFDGVLTDSIKDELAESRKLYDKTVEELKKKREETKKDMKDAKAGGGIFSSMFDSINEGFGAIQKGVKFLQKPNKHFKEGVEASKIKVEVESQSNVLATAGSVEEFNLMTSQQKEVINIAKAQLKQLQKLNKNKTESAGL
jgi:hypothetical protein